MDLLRLQQQQQQHQAQQLQQHQGGRVHPNMMPFHENPSSHIMSPPGQHILNPKNLPTNNSAGGAKPENEFLLALQKGKSQQSQPQMQHNNQQPPGLGPENGNSSSFHPPLPPPGLHLQGRPSLGQTNFQNNINGGANNPMMTQNMQPSQYTNESNASGAYPEKVDGLNGPLPHQMGPHGPPIPHPLGMPQIPLELQPQNIIKHMVKDVVSSNLYKEFNAIRQLSERYNLISVNVEFAGTLARPIGRFRGKSDYIYQTVRTNVDLLDVLKIGISLSDEFGGKPDMSISTWQFHFKMSPQTQMIPIETIELLQKTSTCADTLPQNLVTKGVDFKEFATLLTESGLILNPNVMWITYSAGYDLAFLTQMLKNTFMPNNKEDYIEICKQYFPNFYDLDLINQHLKAAIIQMNNQQAGLNISTNLEDTKVASQTIEVLAEELQIPHFPHHNTAGGQSLLILTIFHKISKITNRRFPDGRDFGILNGEMFGVSTEKESSV